jgi:hypothetical protein
LLEGVGIVDAGVPHAAARPRRGDDDVLKALLEVDAGASTSVLVKVQAVGGP